MKLSLTTLTLIALALVNLTSCLFDDSNKEVFDRLVDEKKVTGEKIFSEIYNDFLKEDMTQYTTETFAHYELNQRIQEGAIIKTSDVLTSVINKKELELQGTFGPLYTMQLEEISYDNNGSPVPQTPIKLNLYFPIGNKLNAAPALINSILTKQPSQIINSQLPPLTTTPNSFYDLTVETARIKDPRNCGECYLSGKKITFYETNKDNDLIYHTYYTSLEVPFMWGYFLKDDLTSIISQQIMPFLDGIVSHCQEASLKLDPNRDEKVFVKVCTVLRDFKKQ